MPEDDPRVEFRENPLRPGIVVSDDGRAFREMRQSPHSEGYRVVGWRVGPGRESRTVVAYVHQLVLEAFVGPCPEGMECRHFPDGDRSNNRLGNLSWGTPAENAADKRPQGTHLEGESHPASRLSESEVAEIRRLAAAGTPYPEVAERFGIAPSTVSGIARVKSWKHQGAGPIRLRNRLGPDDVALIHRLADPGLSYPAIAERFSLRSDTVGRMVRRRRKVAPRD